MDDIYEVFALKYAERNGRTRGDSFLFDDDHASQHDMDYSIWVIRNESRVIVVDTGYDEEEAKRRGRPILETPARCLADFGIDPAKVDTVVITHLHYDHAGSLRDFPNARFHLQAAELGFATGPCMCHDVLKAPFSVEHVVDMVRHVYSGRVVFHDGDGEVAPGVQVHAVGGHSRGLQCVRVKTARGYLVLASDASHYYENFLRKKLFPIVENPQAMLEGFDLLPRLASVPSLIIPGHDPLVRTLFPVVAVSGKLTVNRLDVEPAADFLQKTGQA
ncbi:N-acyl homoserine lactonase family protein [Nitratireductor kimnyeongensis]|uniref:N-acyl homoserine lactonase family protein n=1 Tax=Nitratireductor kimnyeongensis TaxID=430679 RepID=A0ABW0T733_9HYPH|nr:N-acyl homoserine lactonase family protein [Nitratireductor kimnyeongensis]QZZ34049.1 N-acyl homoserine lactonase family protein [Nitratireductor kimnyeongensis]